MDIRGGDRGGRLGPTYFRDATKAPFLEFRT